jgi:serine/threonine protein kinase
VYSFAVIASQILTGKKPFEGTPASQLNEAILNKTRPQLPSNCPEELASIVRDCWVRDYRKRPLFVDICCRLESVRNRLTRGDSYRAPFLGPHVTNYAHGMCSKRSAVRQRNAEVHEDKVRPPGISPLQYQFCLMLNPHSYTDQVERWSIVYN